MRPYDPAIRSGIKKGRNTVVSTLFRTDAGHRETAAVLNRTQASAIPFRLGFIDCFLMVPAAAANRLVHGERGVVGGKAGLTVAAPPESRAAPDRELVDLCRSVTQSIVHHCGISRDRSAGPPWCARLVGLWLLESPYRPCIPKCKVLKRKSPLAYFVGRLHSASSKAAFGWLTRGPLRRLRATVAVLANIAGR